MFVGAQAAAAPVSSFLCRARRAARYFAPPFPRAAPAASGLSPGWLSFRKAIGLNAKSRRRPPKVSECLQKPHLLPPLEAGLAELVTNFAGVG